VRDSLNRTYRFYKSFVVREYTRARLLNAGVIHQSLQRDDIYACTYTDGSEKAAHRMTRRAIDASVLGKLQLFMIKSALTLNAVYF